MNKATRVAGIMVAGLVLAIVCTARGEDSNRRLIAPAGKGSRTTTTSRTATAPRTATTTEAKAATAAAVQPADTGSAGGVGATLKIGTLGLGGEATVGVNDYLGFRLGINALNAGPTLERDEGSVKTDLEWLSYGLLADIHLFGGGFRVSGGGLINKNKFKLSADTTQSVTLDGQQYSLDSVNGEVTFQELAPYIGIGYGNAVGADGRWHFSCDFGVMFQGEPQVSVTATASDPALQPAVDEALSHEVAQIQENASDFKYYPVISVGVSYRF